MTARRGRSFLFKIFPAAAPALARYRARARACAALAFAHVARKSLRPSMRPQCVRAAALDQFGSRKKSIVPASNPTINSIKARTTPAHVASVVVRACYAIKGFYILLGFRAILLKIQARNKNTFIVIGLLATARPHVR